jgi:hypothetical protein
MEAETMSDSNSELQKLAAAKGFRVKSTDNPDRYFVIELATGLPANNPDDHTPFFNRVGAMQFLLETPDLHPVHHAA